MISLSLESMFCSLGLLNQGKGQRLLLSNAYILFFGPNKFQKSAIESQKVKNVVMVFFQILLKENVVVFESHLNLVLHVSILGVNNIHILLYIDCHGELGSIYLFDSFKQLLFLYLMALP